MPAPLLGPRVTDSTQGPVLNRSWHQSWDAGCKEALTTIPQAEVALSSTVQRMVFPVACSDFLPNLRTQCTAKVDPAKLLSSTNSLGPASSLVLPSLKWSEVVAVLERARWRPDIASHEFSLGGSWWSEPLRTTTRLHIHESLH